MWLLSVLSIVFATLLSGAFNSALLQYGFWVTNTLIILNWLLLQELCFFYYEIDSLKSKVDDHDTNHDLNNSMTREFREVKSMMWDLHKSLLSYHCQQLKKPGYNYVYQLQVDTDKERRRIRRSRSFNGFASCHFEKD